MKPLDCKATLCGRKGITDHNKIFPHSLHECARPKKWQKHQVWPLEASRFPWWAYSFDSDPALPRPEFGILTQKEISMVKPFSWPSKSASMDCSILCATQPEPFARGLSPRLEMEGPLPFIDATGRTSVKLRVFASWLDKALTKHHSTFSTITIQKVTFQCPL